MRKEIPFSVQTKKTETAHRVISSLSIELIRLNLPEMKEFLRDDIGLSKNNANKIIERWKEVILK